MKKSLVVLTFAMCLSLASLAQAQDHVFSLTSGSGPVGSEVMVTMNYANNSTADNIQGVNFGVCTADEAIATATAVDLLPDGMGAFTANNVVAGGVTVAIVTSFAGNPTYDPGMNYDLASITYSVNAVGNTAINFCATLGSPPVMVDAANTSAMSVPVSTMDGSIEGLDGLPNFVFQAPTESFEYDGDVGAGSISVNFALGENSETPVLGTPTSGFTMSVANDSAVLTPTNVDDSLLTLALGGTAAAFSGANILPGGAGWTIGIIYDFNQIIAPDLTAGLIDVISVDYDFMAPLDPAPPTMTNLTFETQGTPQVFNEITIGAIAQDLILNNGVITLIPTVAPEFIRADCNQDLQVNIADGITILNQLFQGGDNGGCNEACDSNADTLYDSSDAIFVFNYRFLNGPPPSAPFPDCGIAPDERGDCEVEACDMP